MKPLTQLLFTLLVAAVATPLFAQADTDILFTVDGKEVTAGEFKYIYAKSNQEEADFSKASVMEYLDLYERFKLKVARAHDMGLDTVADLQRELEGYRRQLADNYIVDRQVTDKLVEELYEHQKKDVEFSHIFFAFKGNPTPEDTLALYRKVADLKPSVTAGNFGVMAKEYSDDKYSKDKGGRIGFVSAPLPRGLYALERALYGAKTGQVIGPVQTQGGYHLAIKHSERKAYGEMEVGHILVRKQEGATNTGVPAKITEAQAKLKAGEDFGKVAKDYSEDSQSKDNAGYLGYFGINFYDPAFEAAAFSLSRDGQVSDVVETKAGYHLIRRISRKPQLSLDEVRPTLEAKVKADPRFTQAKRTLLKRTRAEAKLEEDAAAFRAFTTSLDPVKFASARWQPEEVTNNAVLYKMQGGQTATVADFQQYLLRNNRQRISLARNQGATPTTVATKLYNDWIDEELVRYAESRLELDYPEFAALMREYREGILLFEATKMEVWDKASEDTVGLLAFYEANRGDYNWKPRAEVTRYTVDTKSGVDVNEVMTMAKNSAPAKVQYRFGKDKVTTETDRYEYDRLDQMENLKPEVGSVSVMKNDLREGVATFYKVEKLLPTAPKKLDEARGYVIADYQDELERRWVAELRDAYPVKINKKVLNKIIR
ncbi:peptidylprolyl isomerase [Lewinella sp. 4G2]|uniref:peptidylprolyl isomerase n=1 Tax=Lewinella sp. 4G2 TaxID=1803372 RepID=UPI0007B4F550|nr:peptidylprolyl isomerase [Lewinella sp. 4G2]OAV44663.1 hypothetical protein A3850_009240 [Lewinella sp. 4G2]